MWIDVWVDRAYVPAHALDSNVLNKEIKRCLIKYNFFKTDKTTL